jgi:hypothetical protein
MRKIKNDPTKYLKRSDILLKSKVSVDRQRERGAQRRESDFPTAPIDAGGYIDFCASTPKRFDK